MAVIPIQELKQMRGSVLTSDRRFNLSQFQPSSVDLRLTGRVWRVPATFMPTKEPIADVLDRYSQEYYALDKRPDEPFFLESRKPYVVELQEQVSFPKNIFARSNPKSSTGRLDLFARLIADGSDEFDMIPAGYEGSLYLNLYANSFDIKMFPFTCLNQIRLFEDDRSQLDNDGLIAQHERSPLLYDSNNPLSLDNLIVEDGGVFLTLDLEGGEDGIVAYRAKKNARPINMAAPLRSIDKREFWEPVHKPFNCELILEEGYFYILRSKEKVAVPPNLACEMVEFLSGMGEFRTHYAGFFDPGFGYRADGSVKGSHGVLEVRLRDSPMIVRHGQRFVKLIYEQMKSIPDVLYDGNYQNQKLNPGKWFK